MRTEHDIGRRRPLQQRQHPPGARRQQDTEPLRPGPLLSVERRQHPGSFLGRGTRALRVDHGEIARAHPRRQPHDGGATRGVSPLPRDEDVRQPVAHDVQARIVQELPLEYIPGTEPVGDRRVQHGEERVGQGRVAQEQEVRTVDERRCALHLHLHAVEGLEATLPQRGRPPAL